MSHNATIHTNKGQIRLNLEADKVPYTVTNFVALASTGYYDGLTFHRVIEDFMIQTGCPVGNGTGGPWYAFGDEFHPTLRHHKPGILSMANSGPQTNGSQFFITHIETPWLDGKHAVFGSVVDEDDMEVVNNIRQGDVIERIEIHTETFTLPPETKEFGDQIKEVASKKKK